jgi:hypothetical protein
VPAWYRASTASAGSRACTLATINRVVRAIAVLLLVTTACHHAKTVVHSSDVAMAASLLDESGRAKVPARSNTFWDWRDTTTTIYRNKRTSVFLSNLVVGENERFSGAKTPTIGELLLDCPQGAFVLDDQTKRTHPRCMLLAVDGTITVGRHRAPGAIFYGVGGAALGLGLVTCALKCETPYSTISGGAAIIGGVVALAAIVIVGKLLSGDR